MKDQEISSKSVQGRMFTLKASNFWLLCVLVIAAPEFDVATRNVLQLVFCLILFAALLFEIVEDWNK